MSATPVDAADLGRPPLSERLRPHLTGWAFAFPFLVIFLVFLAIPILASFVLSFTGFGIANLRDWYGAEFVGFDNYTRLIDDERFLKAARNTAIFVVVGVPLTIALGLLAAVGLNQAIGRIQGFFRVGYYLPVVTSIVAIAVIWRYLLNPDYGLVNGALGQLGIDGPNWLGKRTTALPSIVALGIWRNLGFDMVIFLAALQGVNPALYEAARVDGARPHQIFFRITVPLLKPTILFLAVITSAGYLQLFEEPFVMTGGGPLDSTLSVAMYVYEQGFRFLNLGYASAVAYVLFVAIITLAFLQFRLFRSEDM
jgi:ABC-type sugar transport system permease subunit